MADTLPSVVPPDDGVIVSWEWCHTDPLSQSAQQLRELAREKITDDDDDDDDDEDDGHDDNDDKDDSASQYWKAKYDKMTERVKQTRARCRRLEESLEQATELLVAVDDDYARLKRHFAGVTHLSWSNSFQSRGQFELQFTHPMTGRSVAWKIFQKAHNAPVGFVVWEAVFTLADYLLREFAPPPGSVESNATPPLHGKTVVEVGAGIGLLGLIMHELGADVWLTDRPNTLPIAQLNAQENGLDDDRLHICPYDWSSAADRARLPAAVDFVVGSELLYSRDVQDALLDALLALATASTQMFICYENRNVDEVSFFSRRLPEHFAVVDQLYETTLHPLEYAIDHQSGVADKSRPEKVIRAHRIGSRKERSKCK